MPKFKLMHGDCVDMMKQLADNSVDSICCDPPYGLSFMGKAWDKGVPSCDVWKEALRVLKPGGHLLAFAGTRTQHRMACAIEDAGFEIRDMIAWVYGSGFPKSHNVGKAIDKAAGAKGEYKGAKTAAHAARKSLNVPEGWDRPWMADPEAMNRANSAYHPATEAAKQWDGWGSALKPALEPITVARKPLAKGNTIAANVLEYGTGAINVDGCRVGMSGKDRAEVKAKANKKDTTNNIVKGFGNNTAKFGDWEMSKGRWPANFIHSGEPEVLDLFPETKSGGGDKRGGCEFFMGGDKRTEPTGHKVDSGSAARFFYQAKCSKKDRDEGLQPNVLAQRQGSRPNSADETGKFPDHDHRERTGNFHPTVKPTDLMRYLCRLVTPPNGTILDPFMGSGSTGKAAVLEGFNFIGCELDAEYIEIAKARIKAVV